MSRKRIAREPQYTIPSLYPAALAWAGKIMQMCHEGRNLQQQILQYMWEYPESVDRENVSNAEELSATYCASCQFFY
jgi:hypothetical protein